MAFTLEYGPGKKVILLMQLQE